MKECINFLYPSQLLII